MKRRDFIKGVLLTTTVLAAGRPQVFAREGHGNLNRLKNRENPSVLEQKHVPGIEAPVKVPADKWFDVKVRVGYMKEHPSTTRHWIRLIKLLVDGEATLAVSSIRKSLEGRYSPGFNSSVSSSSPALKNALP